MFTGMSAFPLTPLINGKIDTTGFTSLIQNLAETALIVCAFSNIT